MLTELLQNAVDHGFPEGSGGGKVVVKLDNDDETAATSGSSTTAAGSSPAFDLDTATGLGLSIVRTLVTTELNGTIAMRPANRRRSRGGRARRPGATVTARSSSSTVPLDPTTAPTWPGAERARDGQPRGGAAGGRRAGGG